MGGEQRLALGPRPALECSTRVRWSTNGSSESKRYVFFTPDSRALIIARGDEFSFWDVATLQPIRRLRRDVAQYPGHVAFSPDGRLMALEMAPAVIHLKEVATGRTVAKLEDPHGDRATWQGFTPDGTQLGRRGRLRQCDPHLGLAGDPNAAEGHEPGLGLARVSARRNREPGRRARDDRVLPPAAATREQRAKQDIERYRREVEAHPDSAQACNTLAWALSDGARGAARRWRPLCPWPRKRCGWRRGMRITATRWAWPITVPAAIARRWRSSGPTSSGKRTRSLALDLYFLAMSHHRLGETARARDTYDWAVRWAQIQRGLSAVELEELTAFRAEAEELLRIDGKAERSPIIGSQRPDAPGP